MAQRSGLGRFLGSVRGGTSPAPSPQPPPASASPAEIRAAYDAAASMYDEGRLARRAAGARPVARLPHGARARALPEHRERLDHTRTCPADGDVEAARGE
jgi:hypothetical protein